MNPGTFVKAVPLGACFWFEVNDVSKKSANGVFVPSDSLVVVDCGEWATEKNWGETKAVPVDLGEYGTSGIENMAFYTVCIEVPVTLLKVFSPVGVVYVRERDVESVDIDV